RLPNVHKPKPEPTGCVNGLCQDPIPSASPLTGPVTTSAPGIPLWPFTTDTQAADWTADPGSRTWAADPVKVVQHLLDDYLELPAKAVPQIDHDADAASVQVTAAGRPVSEVQLVRIGRHGDGP